MNRPPILVTGSHRSGSTWVGNMLALSPSVGYIHEPFGRDHRPGLCAAQFPRWFPYICPENEDPYLRPVADMLAFRYRAGAEARALRSPRDAGRMARDATNFARYRRRQARPLVKDPIAVFSAEWLAERFGCQVVVLIRHPAAFASSLKKLGWTHPFKDFLDQPLLIRDLLGPFREQIADHSTSERPPLDQAILLWQLIHHAVAVYRARHPDWLFLRHEDLSREPTETFRDAFARLGIPFDERIRARIEEYTAPTNQVEAEDPGELRRNSSAGVWNWQRRLSAAEIERVRGAVEPLSRAFYGDRDWEAVLGTAAQ